VRIRYLVHSDFSTACVTHPRRSVLAEVRILGCSDLPRDSVYWQFVRASLFYDRGSDSEKVNGIKTMEREDAVKGLRDIFQRYLDTKRRMAAAVNRLLVKGWPDRKPAAQSLLHVTNLVIECELLRFEHLLSHVPLESAKWTSITTITQRLWSDWHATDEHVLSDASTAYRDIVSQLEVAERKHDRAALDGPFKDARRDPEFGVACEAFAKRNRELDAQLGALRMKWPEASSL